MCKYTDTQKKNSILWNCFCFILRIKGMSCLKTNLYFSNNLHYFIAKKKKSKRRKKEFVKLVFLFYFALNYVRLSKLK